MTMPQISLWIVLLPLIAAIVVGLFGKQLPRAAAHIMTIFAVGAAFVMSAMVLNATLDGYYANYNLYTWLQSGDLTISVGFLIDNLTAMMMVVVTFVSLMVHIYTIGYMHDDPSYARFFSYISLFTFAMLMLVMSNNMLQLFFGWEAVGLVSYLLIGFYYNKPSATHANMKAFLVNRVGDFGFILGIGLVAAYAGTLNYGEAFAKGDELAKLTLPGTSWMLVTVICSLARSPALANTSA